MQNETMTQCKTQKKNNLVVSTFGWKCLGHNVEVFLAKVQQDDCGGWAEPTHFDLLLSQCLKITEKVAFSITSEVSYIYILSGQKLIKNAKNGQFWRVLENLKLVVKQCYQTSHF